MGLNYRRFIEDNFRIINKEGQEIPFSLNAVQSQYIQNRSGRDVILKARQQGFSSLILAMFTTDFLLMENSRSVIVADISDNAMELLDRVKAYIRAYEEINKIKVPLRYNSKYELYNDAMNSRYTIGTADNSEFGRSKTITNLHLSEFAFYPNPEKLFAGAMQAVPESGNVIIETTANGFNYFKGFWEEVKAGSRGFKALFYKASEFYAQPFLDKKRQELGRLYQQEYPETDIEAFLTSGELYFDSEALQYYLTQTKQPIANTILT